MQEKEVEPTQSSETRDESPQREQPKSEPKKKIGTDTLTEDNPFICRGVD